MTLIESARDIFLYALDAVMPKHLLERRIERTGDIITLNTQQIDLQAYRNVYIIGAGKAGAAMSSVMENLLGPRLTEGICIVKYGHTVPLKKVKLIEAGHPIPDEAGMRGTLELMELAQKATAQDLVFCLISGGGSASMSDPCAGISLHDMQLLSSVLLKAGANIHELNTVRKHLSMVKGGRLAQFLAPARTITLLISDVIGDSLDVIASGPTVADSTTFADAIQVLKEYSVLDKVPPPVIQVLEKGIKGEIEETPKAGNPIFNSITNWIIGNNHYALHAAAEKAKLMGFNPCILTSGLFGESRYNAQSLVAMAREVAQSGYPVRPPACLIMGGETTVTVRGQGKGGRCTEFALSAALAMKPSDRFLILAAGTDGTDGPTDAAGAIATPETIPTALIMGIDPSHYLSNND
ncbi:MAG: glycerate kinase, partial [Patescibacteria group bacterium]|nr:glycerate kinase [Patescibacteria group bacterium]